MKSYKKSFKGTSRRHKRTYKRGGGGGILAYPSSNIPRVNNLAYTGTGGTGGVIYPNSNPPLLERGMGFINGSLTKGGKRLKGGSCGCSGKWFGGKGRKTRKSLRGGYVNYAGYPNGLVGSDWTPNPSTWPGVSGPGNNLSFNQYKVDPQTAMVDTNSNYPHDGSAYKKGGKRRGSIKRGGIKRGGGVLTNIQSNLQYNLQSFYNKVNGIPEPVNPAPWKGQFANLK